jgi:hypothetical protein
VVTQAAIGSNMEHVTHKNVHFEAWALIFLMTWEVRASGIPVVSLTFAARKRPKMLTRESGAGWTV